jgi:TPR repeat protein
MEDITGLALITYMIPDLSDPTKRAMLPPSQHKTIAGLLFQGCAENEEPLAIKHIMTAVYLNNHTTHPGARDIALMFPKSEILKYQKILEKIANKNDPEALTLLGLFAEKEAQPAKARAFYEKALQISWVYDYVLGSRHPAQLPIMSPWNALGYLLKSDSKKPASLTQAKEIFEKGANKGDDPLSYYELSNFLARDDPEWLRCITKAAASGHRDAMFRLAEYYNDLGSSNSPISTSKQPAKLKTTLNWLLGWSHESWGQPGTDRLAEQWFEAAANAGHKPALLKWADLLEGKGEGEKARNVLRQIVEPVKGREVEVWPQIVHQAKGRLSGIRVV